MANMKLWWFFPVQIKRVPGPLMVIADKLVPFVSRVRSEMRLSSSSGVFACSAILRRLALFDSSSRFGVRLTGSSVGIGLCLP